MKQILFTTIVAVVLVGCGEKQQSVPAPEAKPAEPVAEVPAQPLPPVAAKADEPVAEASQPELPTAKAPDISIHDAARDGNIEAIKQHLAAGTDANEVERKLTQQSKEYIPMSRRDSALDLALKLPSSSDKTVIVNMLRKNGGKTTKQLSNQDALTRACLAGNMMTIKKLIKDGAHVNSKGRTGVTPLNIAVYSGNRKVVKFLLDNGADVNFKDKEGYAPLHNVMLKEDAELLISKGADVNAATDRGVTPLHSSAYKGRKEIAELLIAKGADVNAKDADGETPLDVAIEDAESEIANLLRKHAGKMGEELKAEGK
jgi:ankyrin repeat protein